jgi:hypothetical protein
MGGGIGGRDKSGEKCTPSWDGSRDTSTHVSVAFSISSDEFGGAVGRGEDNGDLDAMSRID